MEVGEGGGVGMSGGCEVGRVSAGCGWVGGRRGVCGL